MSDIFQCVNCGEKSLTKIKYCKFCTTIEKRKEQDVENAIIRANLSKKYGK